MSNVLQNFEKFGRDISFFSTYTHSIIDITNNSKDNMNILLWRRIVAPLFLLFVSAVAEGTQAVSTIDYDNGDSYVGNLDEHGRKSGRGILKLAAGDVYEGEWLADKRHGKGILKWSDGDVYIGDYKDDIMHGNGKYIWEDGDIYQGEFNDGVFHGMGTMTWTHGSVYEGEYAYGLIHGKGKFTWSDGDEYVGMFFNGKRDGFGTQTSKWKLYQFHGEYSNDKMHGKGVISLLGNLLEFKGEWKDGHMTNISFDAFALLQRLVQVIGRSDPTLLRLRPCLGSLDGYVDDSSWQGASGCNGISIK